MPAFQYNILYVLEAQRSGKGLWHIISFSQPTGVFVNERQQYISATNSVNLAGTCHLDIIPCG